MTQDTAAANVIREHLLTYVDPYLGQSLADAKGVSSVTLAGGVLTVELVLGFPCGDYVAELKAALQNHLGPLLGAARLDLELRANITAHAVQRTPGVARRRTPDA